ncbi:hypothetical protein AB5I41_31640 [Sphingomonas sp. MMS24-JH45]
MVRLRLRRDEITAKVFHVIKVDALRHSHDLKAFGQQQRHKVERKRLALHQNEQRGTGNGRRLAVALARESADDGGVGDAAVERDGLQADAAAVRSRRTTSWRSRADRRHA